MKCFFIKIHNNQSQFPDDFDPWFINLKHNKYLLCLSVYMSNFL
jgi:hypothetical protein